MCGRYTLTRPDKIKTRFSTVNDIDNPEPSYNIAPSQYLPTITRNSPNKITMMNWGFIPHWSKDKKLSLINIRAESVKQKPYFRNILTKYRCLIPSDGFIEWKRVKKDKKENKIPYFIYLKGKKMFSFAGLYRKLNDAEGNDIYTFAILTTTPNSTINNIHDRMPVILNTEDEETWLNEKSEESNLTELLKPFSDKEMDIYRISNRIDNPKNDDETLLDKL